MKKLMFGVGVAAVLLGVGCWEKTNDKQATGSGTVVRIHSLGAADLAQNTNAAKLKRIGSLASSRELREQALEKLARTPYDFWRNQLPSGAENRPALIRALLDDLISAETFLEVRGPKDRTETALAIEINDERARLWSTNLWQLMLARKS